MTVKVMGMESNNISKIICFAVFFSCFSQLPFLVTGGLTQIVCFPFWILLLFVLFIKTGGNIDKSALIVLFPTAIIVIGILMFSIIYPQKNYFESSLLYSYLISVFIFFIGILSSLFYTYDLVRKFSIAYVLATVIVSIVVFFTYFGFSYDINSRVYGYASKNSFAQIVYTAIVIIMVVLKPKRRSLIVAKWILISFEVLLMVFLRSRATLVSFMVNIMVIIISKDVRKSLKRFIIFICLGLIVLLLTNQSVNDMIFNNILFAGRDSSDLDNLSSGRMSIISEFPNLIQGNMFTGIGSIYFECFPLSAILQFGIFIGVIMNIVSIVPLCVSFKRRFITEDWYLLFLLSLGYSIDGIFEGLTPFGAGIKCFYIWFCFGVLLPIRQTNKGENDV